jgi:phosphoribosylformylglycinamidine cyclo-ligase
LSAGVDIHALAHITGGGLTNIDRVIPEGLSVKYLMSEGYFCHNELFKTIQNDYGVKYEEMRTTFNCGVGMVVIMAPESVKNIPDNEFIILGELV